MVSKEVKKMIVEEIEKNQEYLFGSFSVKISQKEKSDRWKGIRDRVADKYDVFNAKSWTYLRDAIWPNMKKCALLKYETQNLKSTRKSSRPFDELDERILRIAQNKNRFRELHSQTRKSSRVTKSEGSDVKVRNQSPFQVLEDNTQFSQLPQIKTEFPNVIESGMHHEKMSSGVEDVPPNPVDIMSRFDDGHSDYDETERMKKEKLFLEVEILRKTNYKMDLELTKLELETKLLALKLRGSQRDFGEGDVTDVSNDMDDDDIKMHPDDLVIA